MTLTVGESGPPLAVRPRRKVTDRCGQRLRVHARALQFVARTMATLSTHRGRHLWNQDGTYVPWWRSGQFMLAASLQCRRATPAAIMAVAVAIRRVSKETAAAPSFPYVPTPSIVRRPLATAASQTSAVPTRDAATQAPFVTAVKKPAAVTTSAASQAKPAGTVPPLATPPTRVTTSSTDVRPVAPKAVPAANHGFLGLWVNDGDRVRVTVEVISYEDGSGVQYPRVLGAGGSSLTAKTMARS
eukprot:TRINITY_DN13474_c0_g3_i1.p1 TRINITY_DN13474_c0_g3~~TRINITY_DN13474_c0_g3_i1.p1  ORF type:complete len:243 (-),score=33.58 TRINITY_DN13474_c0_g3_i1:276-1004(-)